jgi:RNA-binding protein NOB1
VHLKKNFQYSLRGSKFSIPDSKAGQAKGQQKSGNGLILREDQREWQDAVKSEDIRRQKEERKLAKGVLDGWDNPDVSLHYTCGIHAHEAVAS